MKLKDLVEVVPDIVKIHLVFSGEIALDGTKESIDVMVSDEIMDCNVTNIEARDNVLWVWIE